MKATRRTVGVQWRLTWAAALATFLAALVISPTIEAGTWLGQSVVIIVFVAVVGGVTRHAGLPRTAVTAATVLAALLTLTVLFVRDAAVWGLLPGPAAWDAVGGLVREGSHVVWVEAPPVPATTGASLLVVAGVTVVAVLVDALAASWRRAALAGIPLLALYLVPAAVLPDGVPWPLFALCAIGWLGLLLVESRDRLGRWGRSLRLRTGDPSQPAPFQIGGTGRRLGAGALVVAVAVPLLLPALSESILGGGGGDGGGGSGGPTSLRRVVAINPIVDLKRDISRGADVELFTYTTTDVTPSYLRLATLDRFDGTSWDLADTGASADQQAQDGLPAPPGLSPEVPRSTVTTTVTIDALNDPRLPLPYPVTKVVIAGDWRWDANTFDVFSPDDNGNALGISYQATSLDVEPTATELRSAGPPSVQLDPMLTVPDDVTALLAPTVATVTAGATTDYDKALALQTWFRENFTYSLATRSGNSTSDLAAFLQDRSGYCEQFAATMALMARVAGIPSRVQVGFTPGSQDSGGATGTWVVSSHDAHAWPELWFDGVGWVRFEPTPGGGDGGGSPAWAPVPAAGGDQPGSAGGPGTQPNPAISGPHQAPVPGGDERAQRRGGDFGVGLTPAQRVTSAARSFWWVALLVVAVVTLLLLCAPAVERRLIRRRRRRALDVRSALEGAWAEIRDTMADLELTSSSAETARDVHARLDRRGDLTAEDKQALSRLATALEHSRYARRTALDDGRGPGAHNVWRDADTVTKRLLRSVSPRARRRAIWWPESSRERLQLGWGRSGLWVEQLADDLKRTVGRTVARVRWGH
ncbi:MAG: DUF3488 and transglutaminase-like domain-containing protein [Actinomycetes bacterium]